MKLVIDHLPKSEAVLEFWTIVKSGREVATVGSLNSIALIIRSLGGWEDVAIEPELPGEYRELVDAWIGC